MVKFVLVYMSNGWWMVMWCDIWTCLYGLYMCIKTMWFWTLNTIKYSVPHIYDLYWIQITNYGVLEIYFFLIRLVKCWILLLEAFQICCLYCLYFKHQRKCLINRFCNIKCLKIFCFFFLFVVVVFFLLLFTASYSVK